MAKLLDKTDLGVRRTVRTSRYEVLLAENGWADKIVAHRHLHITVSGELIAKPTYLGPVTVALKDLPEAIGSRMDILNELDALFDSLDTKVSP